MLTPDKLDYLIEMNKEVAQRLRKLEQSKYQAYADLKEFQIISGVSATDIRDKLMTDDAFVTNCVRRFDGSRKYYVHVEKALEHLERVLI